MLWDVFVSGSAETNGVCGRRISDRYPLSYAFAYLSDPFVREKLNRFNEAWIEKDWHVFNRDYEAAARLLDEQREIEDVLDEYIARTYPRSE